MLVNQLLLHRIAYIIRMVPYDCILHYIHVHTLEKIQDSCGLKTSVEFRSRNGVMNCRSTVPMVPGRCEEKYRGAAVPCENHMRKSIHGGCRVASPFEAAVTAKDAELLRWNCHGMFRDGFSVPRAKGWVFQRFKWIVRRCIEDGKKSGLNRQEAGASKWIEMWQPWGCYFFEYLPTSR